MPVAPVPSNEVVAIENDGAPGPFVFVCEHASNRFPAKWGTLGLTPAARRAHIAWDPGALGLARGLARQLQGVLVHCAVSRLIYDCNRAPNAPGAMTARSENYDIPGNRNLTADARAQRTASIYLPFHMALHSLIADRLARGLPTVVVTIHSFTPVYFGKRRDVELGVIHDADRTFAKIILAQARAQTQLRAELNAPYSAADDVTHTLRVHATPYGLPNVMLEIRNDLLDSKAAETAMAAQLAPVLAAGYADISQNTSAKAAI
jgi:predicted N-formylglutamate amidohydrolase